MGQTTTCSICLRDDVRLAEKAVVRPCMHDDFCTSCLRQWLDRKRSCPLCKGGVQTYYCRISADGLDFTEVHLPAEERESVTACTQWMRQHTRGQQEPRPYHHRVMALSRGDSRGRSLATSDEQQQLRWRRHIYSRGLYALPLAGSRPTDSSKLRQFVRRDLEAILQTEDALTFAVVMDLAAKSGLDRRGCSGAPAVSHEEAVHTLRLYLGSHAGHFWHEIRAFAATPYTVAVYSSLVQYQGRAGASSHSDENRRVTDYLHWLRTSPSSEHENSGVGPSGSGVWSPPQRTWHSALEPTAQQSLLLMERNATQNSSGGPSGSRNPGRSARSRCLICSGSGPLTGLCLDCAEREAQAQEEARQDHPSGDAAWGSATASERVIDLVPQACQRPSSTGGAAGWGRPDRASSSQDSASREGPSEPTAPSRRRSRSPPARRRCASSRRSSRAGDGRDRYEPNSTRAADRDGPEEQGAERARGRKRQRHWEGHEEEEGRPSAHRHARLSDAEIRRLATHRLRKLLAGGAHGGQQPPSSRENQQQAAPVDSPGRAPTAADSPALGSCPGQAEREDVDPGACTATSNGGMAQPGLDLAMPPAPTAPNDVADDGGGSPQEEVVICLTNTDSEDEVVCLTAPQSSATKAPPLRMMLKSRRRFNAGMK